MTARSPRALPALAGLLALASLAAPAAAQGSSARYRVRFQSVWSSQTHPGAYPNNAHYSPLIGGTHVPGSHFWEAGGIASDGVEVMAETGAPNPLRNEVLAAINAGTAGEVISGNGINSPGMTSTTFTVTDEFPLATVVTMIAPSPDWFVGVDGVNLFQNGEWVDDLVINLVAWDAGTDSGSDFTSANQDTNPAQPIALITSGPLAGLPPLGTFTFRRLASTRVYGCGTNPQGTLQVGGLPLLGDAVRFTLNDPLATLNGPAMTWMHLATQPAAGFPCGTIEPGFGLGGMNAGREVLLQGPTRRMAGTMFQGAPVDILVGIPPRPALVGRTYYAQGSMRDAAGNLGLTEAVEFLVGQ